MDDVDKNIEEYDLNKIRKELILYHDMIANKLSNKKRNPIVAELFIRGRKLNLENLFLLPNLIFLRQKKY